MSEKPRKMYYIDGSAAKVIEEPARKRRPADAPAKKSRPATQKKSKSSEKVSRRDDKALAFNFTYTVYVVAAVMIMFGACFAMLIMDSKVNAQKTNISNLESQLDTLKDENAAYELTLNNMYSLDDIYDIATNELGMVYAKKGQIVYYDSADEDYVKQYQDVPKAN